MQARSAVRGLWWRFALVLLLFGQLSWGMRVPRVNHPDEIWTLDVIRRSYAGILTYILANDNHPPFYYLVIKAWSSIAGRSIDSIRLLSCLFGLLTLLLFALFRLRCRPIAFAAPLLLLATNPLFIYYSATIRPYAFMVFQATLATLSGLAVRSESLSRHKLQATQGDDGARTELQFLFYGSCLLLGLTHYYGLLYAIMLIVWDFWERRISPSRLPSIIVASLLCVWPLTQIFFGSLNQQIKANAWVHVVPVISTLNNFFAALFPSLLVSKLPPYILAMGLMICLSSALLPQAPWLRTLGWRQIKDFLRDDVGYLLANLMITLLISLIIDLQVPFTTPYYFLVGLPAAALLFGYWLLGLRNRLGFIPATTLITTVVVTQIALAQQRLLAP